MKQRFIIATAVLVVVIGAAAVWRPWDEGVPSDTAFRVGDHVVSEADLDRRNDSLRALYGIQEPLDGADRDEFRRQAAKSMAISIVLERAVDEAGIEVPEADVEKAAAAFVDSQFGGDHDAFLDSLGNVNTSEEAVREEIRRQLELRSLLEEVAGGASVTSDQVRTAFAQRKDSLAEPERRVVRNIVVDSRRDARAVRKELDRGVDVAELARAVSIDAATRDQGGELGAVSRAELVPAVGRAVFRTAVGRPYGPVRGPQGWNVGTVSRIVPASKATLKATRSELRRTLESEQVQRTWSEWLTAKLRGAEIRYESRYRPADPYDADVWDLQATGAQP